MQGAEAPAIDFELLGKALGIASVLTADPYDLTSFEKILREEVEADHSSLVIARAPCILLGKGEKRKPKWVNNDLCSSCQLCLEIGCPALSETPEGTAQIDAVLCNGCTICSQVCPSDAIQECTLE